MTYVWPFAHLLDNTEPDSLITACYQNRSHFESEQFRFRNSSDWFCLTTDHAAGSTNYVMRGYVTSIDADRTLTSSKLSRIDGRSAAVWVVIYTLFHYLQFTNHAN